MSELETFLALEEKPAGKLELIASLQEKVGALDEGVLSPNMARLFKENSQVFCTKFLMARKWHLENAIKMVLDTAEFRHREKLDVTPLFPATAYVRGWDEAELEKCQGLGPRAKSELDYQSAAFQGGYAGGWHKKDKLGRPLYIERTGHIRVREYVAICKKLSRPGEEAWTATLAGHINSNEVGTVILRRNNEILKEQGKPLVHQATVILDMQGLGLGHLYHPALDILKHTTGVDQEHYPEGMSRLYVVNCPAMVNIAWSMVKIWLDPQIHKKITFHKPHETMATLLTILDVEDIPEFLGGTCRCPGDCVPDVTDSDQINIDAGDEFAVTTPLRVPSRKTLEHRIENLEAGETIMWEFACENKKHDVICRAAFHPAAEGGEPTKVDDSGRKYQGSGTFLAPAAGSMVYTLDNSFSYLNAKQLGFRVVRTKAAAEAGGSGDANLVVETSAKNELEEDQSKNADAEEGQQQE